MRKKYVYDLPTRIMHAGIGMTTLLLLLTAALAHVFFEQGPIRHDLWLIHLFFGNILIVFLGFRFVYFFIGPDHSRLSDLVKLNAWKTIIISFWEKKERGPLYWPWGHHPVASFFYLIVYVALSGLAISGVILSRVQFDQGFIPERFYDDVTYLRELMQTHEILAWTVLGFTLIHLSALFYHQKKDKLPVFEAMKTGFQYKHNNIPKKVPGDFNETDQI